MVPIWIIPHHITVKKSSPPNINIETPISFKAIGYFMKYQDHYPATCNGYSKSFRVPDDLQHLRRLYLAPLIQTASKPEKEREHMF